MVELVAGRYQLVRALGRGGMGEVMLARQLNLDRLVVVKRVTDVRSKRNQRALLDEARIAARLNHPNIVSVLDVIEPSDATDQPAVVMEFVAGVSLRELIEDAPDGLGLDIALPIAIDLLRGLGYAHAFRSGDSIGVVHRDVKPRNVMVTFTGVTKLIDFGISRWLSDDGAWDASSVSGTRGYMAPEQQRGERLDGRADIYAAGVTLREMLTGVPPVDDTGHTEALKSPRAVGDPRMAAIIDRACSESATDRFADCDAMIAALEEVASAAGISVSMSAVRRWTSTRFAERKQMLETADRTPALRPPTSPTMFDGGIPYGTGTVSIGSRVVFAARNAGESGDDWLGPVVERLILRYFRVAEDRRFHVGGGSNAQRIELVFRREPDRFDLDAIVAGEVAASVTAASVVGAVEAIARATNELAAEQSIESSPEEAAEMQRIGARSFRVFQRYRAAIDAYFRSTFVDSRAIAATLEDVLDEDPE